MADRAEKCAEEKVISHRDARLAIAALVDEHFKNGKYRTKFSIPAEPDDTDLLLMEYVRQQEARSHFPDDGDLREAAKAALKLYDSVPREAVEIMELFNAMERLRAALQGKEERRG